MKIANTLVGSATFLLLSCSALAFDNFKDFNKDHLDMDLSTQYYRTESNFGSNGSQENLPAGNYFQAIETNFALRYVLSNKTALFGSANLIMAESKGFTGTRNGTGFNEFMLGMEYLAYSQEFDLVPEVSFILPGEKVSMEEGNDIVMSEGAMEVRPKVSIQKDFGRYAAYAHAGFSYRSEGRSFLLPWGVGGFTRMGSSRLGAELFGYQSMTDDDSNNNKFPRLAHLSTVNGGSQRYGGFNPSIVDTNFFFHYNPEAKFSFQLAAGLPLTGTNTANGIHLGAMLSYAFDFSKGEPRVHRYTPTPKEAPRGRSEMYGREEPAMTRESTKFREDTKDGVDQRLFKSKALTPKKKRDPVLQQQLDDVEMEIELKNVPTKKKRR